jgi:hypothetical protein
MLSRHSAAQEITQFNSIQYFINIIKFSELMSSKRKPILKKLCHFIRAINTGVCPPGS